MHFDWWTLGLQTVNFAVLVWLLHRFLYKPVLRLLDARNAEIEKHYADAQAAEAKAKEQLAAVEAERIGIVKERETVLAAATTQADELARARRSQAEVEAATLLDGARKTLAEERGRVIIEAQKLALDLGADFARRLLVDAPAKLRTEAWLEQIEQYFAGLPKTKMDALGRQSGNGAGLIVVTAVPLPSETAELWRARLRKPLGDGVAIDFAVDTDLVAGAELHFPSSVLLFSWRSALATARAEVMA